MRLWNMFCKQNTLLEMEEAKEVKDDHADVVMEEVEEVVVAHLSMSQKEGTNLQKKETNPHHQEREEEEELEDNETFQDGMISLKLNVIIATNMAIMLLNAKMLLTILKKKLILLNKRMK